jgi:hypothetical protein
MVAHYFASPWGEPFRNNDETRHVMTGVFVHDALRDLPEFSRDPKGYTVRYYLQYPALGILVWPPLFYVVEGVAMLALGPSYGTARLVLTSFAILAAVYFYRLVQDRFGQRAASVATGLFVFSPLVFDLSRYCLLEVPTLAMVLASVYHFERYLESRWRWDAWLACLFAAAAVLTRFDGVMLVPYIGLRILFTKSWSRLLDRPVIGGVVFALALTLPYYVFTWLEYRTGLQAAAVQGTGAESTGFLALQNLWLYVSFLPHMLGWNLLIISIYGLYRSYTDSVANVALFLTLIIATYITFVPLAEPEPRHAIYWVPGWCLFGTIGILKMFERCGKWYGLGAVCLVFGSTAWDSLAAKGSYFKGYSAVAAYCQTHRQTDRPWMCDGTLTGGFIVQVRQHDPERKVTILRGDKLLYAVLSDANARYDEFATDDQSVIDLLQEYDPEFIVVENPSLLEDMPASQRLRKVLHLHPEKYVLVERVAITTNHYWYAGKHLEVWRKLQRNPNAKPVRELPVLGLGRSVGATK